MQPLSLWQKEPSVFIAPSLILALVAVIIWAPVDGMTKSGIVAGLVAFAFAYLRSLVTPVAKLPPGPTEAP